MRESMGGNIFQVGGGLPLIFSLCEGGGGVEIDFCLMRGGYDLVLGYTCISPISQFPPPPKPGNYCTVPYSSSEKSSSISWIL